MPAGAAAAGHHHQLRPVGGGGSGGGVVGGASNCSSNSQSNNNSNINCSQPSSGGGGHLGEVGGLYCTVPPSNVGGAPEDMRTVKYVAANTFSHIPSSTSVQFTSPQPGGRFTGGQLAAGATLVNRRGYATFPVARASQHQHHQPLQQPHSPSLAYVKEVTGSLAIGGSGAGGGGAAVRPGGAVAKRPVYYNYTTAIGGGGGGARGPKLEFKDRNGFVHNMSYVASGPKRHWTGPAPRYEGAAAAKGYMGSSSAVTTGGGGGGGGGRDWPTPYRHQYTYVTTTTTSAP